MESNDWKQLATSKASTEFNETGGDQVTDFAEFSIRSRELHQKRLQSISEGGRERDRREIGAAERRWG